VQVAAGSSYADTVRAVRQDSELNLAEIGAQVTGMRRTKDGHLLSELAKDVGSVKAAQKLSSVIVVPGWEKRSVRCRTLVSMP